MIKNKTTASLFCIMLLLSCHKISVKNYFIPQDFTGNVAIIYNNNNNESPSKEEFNYSIPENGILYTDNSFKEGRFKANYFQKNRFNKFDTLLVEYPGERLDSTKNRIYFHRVLTLRKGNGPEVIVSTFYVGKTKSPDLEKERFSFERYLEKLIIGE